MLTRTELVNLIHYFHDVKTRVYEVALAGDLACTIGLGPTNMITRIVVEELNKLGYKAEVKETCITIRWDA